jgi:hypothetical protein
MYIKGRDKDDQDLDLVRSSQDQNYDQDQDYDLTHFSFADPKSHYILQKGVLMSKINADLSSCFKI